MKSQTLLPFAIAAIFRCASSSAQGTYIVTNKGDTIYGNITLIPYNQSAGEVRISPAEGSKDMKRRTYSASSLRCFAGKGMVFESQLKEPTNPNAMPERIFVRKRVAGNLTLYEEDDVGPRYLPVAYYFKRSQDSFISRARKNKKKLLEYFKDCTAVVDALTSNKIGPNNLDALVKLYNEQCPPSK